MNSLALSLLLLLAFPPPQAQNHGMYNGEIVTRWEDDGRTMILLEDFHYVDPTGLGWKAPKGLRVDGASIPPAGWTLVGGPFEGKYRKASVIHDAYCVSKTRHWKDVHYAFYTAMLAAGTEEALAKKMYAAVFHKGPKWPVLHTEFPPTCDRGACHPREVVEPAPTQTLTDDQFNQLVAVIDHAEKMKRSGFATDGITLEQIRQWPSLIKK